MTMFLEEELANKEDKYHWTEKKNT